MELQKALSLGRLGVSSIELFVNRSAIDPSPGQNAGFLAIKDERYQA